MQVDPSNNDFDILLFSRREDSYRKESHTHHQDLNDDDDDIDFSQHSHSQRLGSSECIDFSQSEFSHFAESSRLHLDKNTNKMEKEVVQMRKEIELKNSHIKQLTDFLNTKKKEEGSINLVVSQELERLHNDLTKKDILMEEMAKNIKTVEEELLQKIKHTETQEITINKLVQQNNNILALDQDKDTLFEAIQRVVEDQIVNISNLEKENKKLKDENEVMSRVINENVGEMKPIRRQTSDRGFENRACNNCASLKAKKEDAEEKSRQFNQKYEEVKAKLSNREREMVEVRDKVRKLESELRLKEVEIKEISCSLEENVRQMRVGKQKEEKVTEMERRLDLHRQQIEKKESRIIQLVNEITEKNKVVLTKTKSENEAKSRLEVEVEKNKAVLEEKESLARIQAQLRETIKVLNKEVEMLRGKSDNHKKQSQSSKQEEKEKVSKLEKELAEKTSMLGQIRGRIEEDERKVLILKSKNLEFEALMKDLKEQLHCEKEKSKKLITDSKKRGCSESELENKIKILQTMVQARSNPHPKEEELEDKILYLEAILQDRDQEIEELKHNLKLQQSQQLDNEINQDLVNFHLKDMDDNDRKPALALLKNELAKKYQIIEALKKDLMLKDKALKFTMDKFMESEKEKLRMEQAEIKTRYSLEESNDEICQEQDPEAPYPDTHELMEEIRDLQTRNQDLERQLHDCMKKYEDYRYKTGNSDSIKDTITLRNKVEELKDQIDRLNSEAKRKGAGVEKMSSQEVMQMFVQLLKRISKSSEVLRVLMGNEYFLEVVKKVNKRREEEELCYKRRG